MKCKECQEYILTDYIDNEFKKDIKQKMEDHFSMCHECKEFAVMARKAVVEPFEKSERVEPPEMVWENIKGEISEGNLENQVDWLERFKKVLFPRPAFAFATLACLLLMVLVLNPGKKQGNVVKKDVSQIQEFVKKYSEESQFNISEQVEYIVYLFDEQNGYEEYGTSIEEYFL